ncbi:MAG: hypothetical protein M4D80_31365 [Myxococcota bacterium]|nr:hypothetical protein [Deltaproteobacteria bacterium]MDQ3339689.1 hypothetical protein [Myxococcota bacterium]
MRALAVIALLATAAHAESQEMLLVALARSMDRQEASCAAHLDELQRRRVPASRTIRTKYGSRQLRAGVHTLAAVRTACDALRIAAVERAIARVQARFPEGLDECLATWRSVGLDDKRLAERFVHHCEAPKAMLDAKREARGR